eukprot:TRINITY_DN8820_c0_g2_i1.p1 TRINITY_DN8820_c0_g2~~TRINITY_DN8820_c0_g2_i1.p1  ORF type:complete len:610 (+),score=32.45 TRINITY_DN8820_c0_g2_i1:39-1868(+)
MERQVRLGLVPIHCLFWLISNLTSVSGISLQQGAHFQASSCPRWCSRKPVPWKIKCSYNGCLECPVCKDGAVKRPNIVLILADDVGQGDIPWYWGSAGLNMPNMDDLIAKGVLFHDMHSAPLCAPSRYVLMSGNYIHRGRRFKANWFNGSYTRFDDGQQSLAQVLRDQGGYHTAMMGKWHLGGRIPPNGAQPGWKKSTMLLDPDYDWTQPLGGGPQDIGFDSSLITTAGIQDPPYAFFSDGVLATSLDDVRWWDTGSYPTPNGLSRIGRRAGQGAKDWDSTAYDMILVNETIRFVDDHLATRPDQPFFAYVSLGTAHTPHSAPFFYLDGTPVAQQQPNRHMDMLVMTDKVVGSLIGMLEERSLLNDTIVVFAGDNGGLQFSLGQGHDSSGPLRDKKGSMYEGGHRVPFVMRWDGAFPAGQNRSRLVGFSDVFATLCNFAGADVPSGQALDSVDFANYVLRNDARGGLRRYHGIWDSDASRDASWDYYQVYQESIREKNLKLIRTRRNGTIELYNLGNDLSETTDLSQDPKQRRKIDRLLGELWNIGPAQPCEQWCSQNSTAWEEKCTWLQCQGCSRCYLACRNWCERNDAEWTEKCDWNGCRGCEPCSP